MPAGGDGEVEASAILSVVADEVGRQHRIALEIQESVSSLIIAERPRSADIDGLQKLDTLSQTLENLHRVLDVLLLHPLGSVRPQDIAEAVTLGDLRRRLVPLGERLAEDPAHEPNGIRTKPGSSEVPEAPGSDVTWL